MNISFAGTDLAELARQLGPGRLVTDPVELLTYEQDASTDCGRPDAIAFPRTRDDVAAAVRWAATHHVPVIARGAGTGLSGGAVAERGGLILGFSRMGRIVELDVAGRSATVEPGVVNLVLDEAARSRGLYFPPDPASGRSATIGGNIAENAGGPHCFKYGVTSNYLTGLEVVLADGRVVWLGGRALDYPEFDLVGLVCGSEGTLAVVTRASFRLLALPQAVKTLMASFDSIASAGAAVSAIIARGLVPATMEMMDQKIMRIIEDYAHAGLPVEAGAALIVEADGYPESVGPQIAEIAGILDGFGASTRIAESAEERDRIWYGRKSAAGAMARLAPAYYLVDGTVPRSKLVQVLDAIDTACQAAGLRVGYVFHAGDGNLHPFILIPDPGDEALIARVLETGRRVMSLCVDVGGSITGEHGVGMEKRVYMPLMYSAEELAIMQDIKQVFDPKGILNPGKIFPQPEGDAEAHRHGDPGTVEAPVAEGPTAGRSYQKDQKRRPTAAEAVYCPTSPAQAAEAVQALATERIPVRIEGGGTKSAGLAGTPVCLSTAALRGIRTLSLDDLYVTLGAGTSLSELQAELKHQGMWVPLASPWPNATVGGIIATNFNAPLRMRYGALRDLVLCATVVLPDGRLIRVGRPVVKNVAGYDLPKLFVGSHGTLGLLTDVTLKLAPLPRARATLMVSAPDAGAALAWGGALLRTSLVASAILAAPTSSLPPGIGSASPFVLLYTTEGLPEDVAGELAAARAALAAAGAPKPYERVEPSASEIWAGWSGWRGGEGALMRTGVPAKDLLCLSHSSVLIADRGSSSFVADLASGVVYLRTTNPLAVHEATQSLDGYAVVLNGTPPGERWGYRPDSLELMQRIKGRWDPQGLFNPGAFLV